MFRCIRQEGAKKNKNMNQEKTLPFKWKDWDEQDVLFNSYYDVEFTEDFGSIKSGEKFSSIAVNYGEGWIEAYSEDGLEVLKRQNFKSIAV